MNSKKCTKCGEVKGLSSFYIQNIRGGYVIPTCKQCIKSNTKKHRHQEIESDPEYYRKHYIKYRDKTIKRASKWYQKNTSRAHENSAKCRKKQAISLSDNYVKKALNIQFGLINNELIEAKRAQLKLHRAIKNY